MRKKEKLLKKQHEAKIRIENKVNSILFPSFIDASYKDNPYLALKNVNKIYPNNVQAVFDFNLFVNKEEFIVFVGPSGCGKSTTLRMICGLEEISSGSLFIDGKYSNDLAPKDRDIAMVFQSYALYPHMSVYDNMAFSLKIRKIPVQCVTKDNQPIYWIDKNKIKQILKRIKELDRVIIEAENDIKETKINEVHMNPVIFNEMMEYYETRIQLAKQESKKQQSLLEISKNNPVLKHKYRHIKKDVIKEKVLEVSKILEIEHFLNRKPKALSGGQRQRVALGRAIVRDAKVFLMDEPLSNLDAKLRVQMRAELVSLHKRLKATTVYVTHDQTEAMTMADRIVVMKDGVVQQIGSPKDIYDRPTNLFVATFIGAPSMNIVPAKFKDGKIIINDNDVLKINKKKEIKAYFEGEINRFNELSTSLDNALLDETSSNIDVYKLAKEKVNALLDIYSFNLKNDFDLLVGIRPEHIIVRDDERGIKVRVQMVELLGSEYCVHAFMGGNKIIFKTNTKKIIKDGDEVYIEFDTNEIHGFEKETSRALF